MTNSNTQEISTFRLHESFINFHFYNSVFKKIRFKVTWKIQNLSEKTKT